ncbi:LPS-assembly protein LptD [Marinimicrococcus flavescens]|uniref:LPS-assembly protein LptD n=1 Tax=Marinimicrococcus flavescens TaxID=3031815 RepID=A0AAP3XQC4_9PROT|nr:LPS assembly protein LptD [Marinimicrococcus flavescens]
MHQATRTSRRRRTASPRIRRLTALLLASALPLFLSAGAAPTAAEEARRAPVVLTADEVTFDTEKNVITAAGGVELSQDGRRLLADRVSYDEPNDRVVAEGHVVLVEEGGETFFGDSAEVTGDLREGVVERLGALLAEETRLAAIRGTRREGNFTVLEQAVYSPCPLCEEGDRQPLWQIRAKEVEHDQEAGTITYRHATFELLGVPLAYTPWFSHPDPTVKRRSGFLVPTGGSNSELGLTLETPYYYTFAPNRDFTFTPLFTTQAGVVLGGEYRELREIGETRVGGSITRTDPYEREPGRDGGKEVRGHVEADGRYRPGRLWDAGFDLAWTSDDSYLKRYDISSQNVLQNHAYLQQVVGRDYLALHSYAFQGLRPEDSQGRIPVVLPLAEASLESSPLKWGSQLTFDTSFVALTRTEGLDTRRFSAELGWELPWVGPIGDLWRLRLSSRGDIYNIDGDPQSFSNEGGKDSQGRFVPRASLDWSWPLIGDTGSWQHVLEPAVAFTATPTGGREEKIPNEDSQVFEFDETNLFEPSRFPGLDRIDEGTRVAYGLRFSSLAPNGLSVGGVFGQSYQFVKDDTVPEDSGIGRSFSDYVGRLDFRPSDWLDLSYRFRADKNDLEFRRNDINVSAGPAALRLDLGYLRLSDEPTGLAPRSREELRAGVRVQLLDELAIGAQTRRDLNRGATVSNMVGLVYTHPCLTLTAGLEQSNTTTGELEDTTTFKVRVSLSTLGAQRLGTGLFGS